MRNLISFSCHRAALSFCLATIKVSRRRASKLFIDLVMVSLSQKPKCLVPRSNWTVQRHFCPDCTLACCYFSNAWCSEGIQVKRCGSCFQVCQADLTLSFWLEALLHSSWYLGHPVRHQGSTDPLAL